MAEATVPTGASTRRPWYRSSVVAVGVPLLIGLVHVAIVSRHYFVGSFDDDASYILSAKALLAGQGLTGHLTSGAVVAGAYPVLYPVMLVPLLWLWPHSDLPLRLLSVGCVGALFPLTWTYLRRLGVPPSLRTATLVLLALNPVLATFASMVMAEVPFLVVLVAGLLAVQRWDQTSRVWCPAGVATVVAAAGLIWTKEAALGLVVGLVVWLLLRRQPVKAVAVAVGALVLLLPLLLARAAAHMPLLGSRYSQELGGYYSGGLVDRLLHVAPTALHQYFAVALPASIVPRGAPLPELGTGLELARVLSWNVSILCVVGLLVSIWRFRDAAVVMVPVYGAETLLWPFVNERRVILVLPVVVAWYAIGAWAALRAGAALVRQRRAVPVLAMRAVGVAVVGALVVAPLVAQASRDYLFGDREDSSRPAASRYTQILSATPDRRTVVETDYPSTLALDTGHPTANGAFLANLPFCTDDPNTRQTLIQDQAGYLILGALNKPHDIDSTCLSDQARRNAWSIRLMESAGDDSSVFELIGPGTPHAGLRDLTTGASVRASGPFVALPPDAPDSLGDPGGVQTVSPGGSATFTWQWRAPSAVTQVSVGEAKALDGRTHGVQVLLETAPGHWRQLASSGQAVGDGAVDPFVLVQTPAGTSALGVRVVVRGSGVVKATDVHVLGPLA